MIAESAAGLDALSSRVRAALVRAETPLQVLEMTWAGRRSRLGLKLEGYNPSGSVKYRTAVGLLAQLQRTAPLVPGTTVVESTSGNLGLALVDLLAEMDCRFIAVVDPKVSPKVRHELVARGAQVVAVEEADERGQFLPVRLRRVRELCRADASLRWTNQYESLGNPAIHRMTTGPELFRQSGGAADAVFVAVSTGGTLAGISESLHELAPHARVVAVDAVGSGATGAPPSPHLLNGIGSGRPSSFLTRDHYDCVARVHDVEAFAVCRMVADDIGLRLGGSSGAVIAAFANLTATGFAVDFPVALCPDGGDNYTETIYNDEWLAGKGVLTRVRSVVADARAGGLLFTTRGRS